MISIDEAGAEARYQTSLSVQVTPESLFERQWGLTLLERVHARLRAEYSGSGKLKLFQHLESCLPGAESGSSYAQISAALEMSEGAVRVAVVRLRQRYAELLRAEIAATVSRPEEIQDEIRHMIEVTS